MPNFEVGQKIDELSVTPDKYVPHRYAGASGDFNPIHIDAEFAKMVGLPGSILHGLYVMGLVAQTAARAGGGDPRVMKKLSVQFRGMSFPEQEIVVTGEVKAVEGDTLEINLVATQNGNGVIRNTTATLEVTS